MTYEQILKFVQSIIDSFTNVAVAHLNGLKAYLSKNTFSVKVSNPVTKMKVEGDVKVSNMPPLLKAIGGIPLALNALKNAVVANKSVMVTNLKDLKFPEFPKKIEVSNPQKEVKITNMKEFTDAVGRIAEFVAKIKYDPRIEVKPADVKLKAPIVNVAAPIVNVPEQKPPVVNVEAPDLSQLKKLLEFFEALNAKKPLPVRLSDGKNFYKALEKMAEIYTGSTFSVFRDKNGDDARAVLGTKGELFVSSTETWIKYDIDINTENITYEGFGKENDWMIKKIEINGQLSSIRYAVKGNNDNIAYSDAWENRMSLFYSFLE